MLRLLQHQVGRFPHLCSVSPRVARAFATETESAIQEKLQKALTVKDVDVRDTSGGCGTMFEIKVAADEFNNKSIVQQHKVVTKILQEEISQWHGFVLLTSAPNNS
ncbi:TPA: BolA-like protein 3 [Trebouxia sp. C0005]